MNLWDKYGSQLCSGDVQTLARCITLVENESNGFDGLLEKLPHNHVPVIGITGPPGAGKSSLTDSLIGCFLKENKKVAVLCIDPSSPFSKGAILGDRIRMNRWFNEKNVFIRSLSSKGSLGGLHPHIIEITDLVKTAGFDLVIIETVGVGQSEVEIAGLADITLVVLVPEAGDDVQAMKSGLMEVADIFVVNKSDRPDAESFVKNLQGMQLHNLSKQNITEVVATSTLSGSGIEQLKDMISNLLARNIKNDNYFSLMAERAFYLIRQKRMKDIDKENIKREILSQKDFFNLYTFIKKF